MVGPENRGPLLHEIDRHVGREIIRVLIGEGLPEPSKGTPTAFRYIKIEENAGSVTGLAVIPDYDTSVLWADFIYVEQMDVLRFSHQRRSFLSTDDLDELETHYKIQALSADAAKQGQFFACLARWSNHHQIAERILGDLLDSPRNPEADKGMYSLDVAQLHEAFKDALFILATTYSSQGAAALDRIATSVSVSGLPSHYGCRNLEDALKLSVPE